MIRIFEVLILFDRHRVIRYNLDLIGFRALLEEHFSHQTSFSFKTPGLQLLISPANSISQTLP